MKKKKKRIIIIAGCCIFFSGISSFAIYKIAKRPPDFEKLSDEKVMEYLKTKKVENLDKENLAKLGERLEKIQPEKRREMTQNLPEEERRKMFEKRRLVSEAVLDKTIDEFFSLPKDKQDEFLDKQIQQMDERRRSFQGRVGERGGDSSGFRNRPDMTQGGTATAQGQTATTRRDFRGMGRGQRNPDAMLQRNRNMLSRTTPEERAKRREYFRRLMERRGRPRR